MPHRFFMPASMEIGQIVELPLNIAHYAAQVLRLKPEAEVTLFDGKGNEHQARIVRSGKILAVEITSKRIRSVESPLRIELAQAISAGERMEFTLQKSVELGIAEIQPLASERSVVKLQEQRAQKRQEHWQKVVISACEQSGRTIVPPVKPVLPFAHWIAQVDRSALKILLSPDAEQGLKGLALPNKNIILLIGPEGGFSQNERIAALNAGFVAVKLGPRTLRTETAALAALAAIQMLWGDFTG